MRAMKKNKPKTGSIAQNKKARHEFHLEDKFEAGLALQGWEVKSLRAGKVSITETYVTIDRGEAYLLGCRITPLNQASSHVLCEPERPRKLLLNKRELEQMVHSS